MILSNISLLEGLEIYQRLDKALDWEYIKYFMEGDRMSRTIKAISKSPHKCIRYRSVIPLNDVKTGTTFYAAMAGLSKSLNKKYGRYTVDVNNFMIYTTIKDIKTGSNCMLYLFNMGPVVIDSHALRRYREYELGGDQTKDVPKEIALANPTILFISSQVFYGNTYNFCITGRSANGVFLGYVDSDTGCMYFTTYVPESKLKGDQIKKFTRVNPVVDKFLCEMEKMFTKPNYLKGEKILYGMDQNLDLFTLEEDTFVDVMKEQIEFISEHPDEYTEIIENFKTECSKSNKVRFEKKAMRTGDSRTITHS